MEERRKDLINQSELIMGFGKLREKLNDWEIKSEKKANELIDTRLGVFYLQFKRKTGPGAFSKKKG